MLNTLPPYWPDEGEHCHCICQAVSGRDFIAITVAPSVKPCTEKSSVLLPENIHILLPSSPVKSKKKERTPWRTWFLKLPIGINILPGQVCLMDLKWYTFFQLKRNLDFFFLSSDFYVGEMKFITSVL